MTPASVACRCPPLFTRRMRSEEEKGVCSWGGARERRGGRARWGRTCTARATHSKNVCNDAAGAVSAARAERLCRRRAWEKNNKWPPRTLILLAGRPSGSPAARKERLGAFSNSAARMQQLHAPQWASERARQARSCFPAHQRAQPVCRHSRSRSHPGGARPQVQHARQRGVAAKRKSQTMSGCTSQKKRWRLQSAWHNRQGS